MLCLAGLRLSLYSLHPAQSIGFILVLKQESSGGRRGLGGAYKHSGDALHPIFLFFRGWRRSSTRGLHYRFTLHMVVSAVLERNS